MKRLLDADGGIIRTFLSNNDGTFAVRMTMDAEPTIESNKILQNEHQPEGWRKVASIPMTEYLNMLERAGMDWHYFHTKLEKREREAIENKLLMDSDYKWLRSVHSL